MKFKTTIWLGNDAMQTPQDVCDALRRVIADLSEDDTFPRHTQSIYDANGNRVGGYVVREED